MEEEEEEEFKMTLEKFIKLIEEKPPIITHPMPESIKKIFTPSAEAERLFNKEIYYDIQDFICH